MNYLAHGVRFLDRPVRLIGTAVPDLLSACDRRVRIRSRHLPQFANDPDPFVRELVAGIEQHLIDDDRFHESATFAEMNYRLSRMFRSALGPTDEFRPGFLGHIVTEMLLDAALIAEEPDRLDRYYTAFGEPDAERVREVVNQIAPRPSEHLTRFIGLFREHQFLRDYPNDPGLRMRINGVLKRVKLPPLPESIESVLAEARELITENREALLP